MTVVIEFNQTNYPESRFNPYRYGLGHRWTNEQIIKFTDLEEDGQIHDQLLLDKYGDYLIICNN